ncbi:MAG: type I-C CRISPR-associated endonuclease Cas1c [Muribaculaceae bacterium]|nr:type I-C CRISPR-associated endonuclease Cas1c [Muribaculaceae bacterium]
MKKLLNTLYVTTPEAYLTKDGENIVVSVKQEERFRIPIINIENVVCFTYMGATPGVMKLCADNGVGLAFMSPKGQFIARMQGPTRGNIYLRHRQHLIDAEPQKKLAIARLMIAAKIFNSRTVLARFIRDYGANAEVDFAIKQLFHIKNKCLGAGSDDELLGIEGQAAHIYFGVLKHLLTQQKKDFDFNERNRRPPKDPFNAMLSFAYTLLANDISSALEATGLDPYMGVFHKMRPGRASLALDVMEEFRAYLCDRFVLSMINRRQITARDFTDNGGVRMTDDARRKFLAAWQERKRETIVHPFLKEKVPIGLLPHIQAMMLARHFRGDLDNYPVFIFR